MSEPDRLSGVVLDCDGVLIESVDIKTQAYRNLFVDFPEHLDAIVSYHLAHGGVSRAEKIRHVYKDILNCPLSATQLTALCDRFASLSLDRVLAAPLVRGAREFLETYGGRLHLFVASGTPQQELDLILDRRGLRGYFTAVFGSPLSKVEIIGRILSAWALRPESVLAVGDAPTDREAAAAYGIRYIARVSEGWPTAFPNGLPLERVRDLTELCPLVDRLVGTR